VVLLGGLAFWFLRRRNRADEAQGEADISGFILDIAPGAQAPRPEPDLTARDVAAPPVAPANLGPPPKRGAHAIFDLGAVAAPPEPSMLAPEPSMLAPEPSMLVPEPTPQPSPRVPSRAAPPPSPPPPPPPPPPAPPLVTVGRPQLDIELRPRRAGTNLTSAAVDYEIVVRNTGGMTARQVRLDVRLLSAGAQQDEWIKGLFAEPIQRPITAPFDLPPNGAIEMSGMALAPRDTLNVMTVEGRALFVPVLTINLLYDWQGAAGQVATSHVIGIDRGEGAKMAPFRLDSGARMHEGVTSLPYTISVRR
jgi:hypothetical protein